MSDSVSDVGPPPGVRALRAARGHLTFLRAFLLQPQLIGSAIPSSRRVARALLGPYTGRDRPARVLEVGAGTGAITRHIGLAMRDQDELSICEMQPSLASHVRRVVLAEPQFVTAVRDGRVTLEECAIQNYPLTAKFDYVISGLPFNSFTECEVRAILDVIRGALKPGGVFSYFEYVALRRLTRWVSIGRARQRVRGVSAVLEDHIARYQFSRQIVLGNLPPACTRHWRFV